MKSEHINNEVRRVWFYLKGEYSKTIKTEPIDLFNENLTMFIRGDMALPLIDILLKKKTTEEEEETIRKMYQYFDENLVEPRSPEKIKELNEGLKNGILREFKMPKNVSLSLQVAKYLRGLKAFKWVGEYEHTERINGQVYVPTLYLLGWMGEWLKERG